MAEIGFSAITSWSFTVQLVGLDTSYAGTTRTAQWYLKKSTETSWKLWEVQTVETAGQAYFPEVLLDGLDCDTTYDIRCKVSNEIGQEFGPWETQLKTNAFYHYISGMSIEQTKFTPPFCFLCKWSMENFLSGDTKYKITVWDGSKEWTKATGTVSASACEAEIEIENEGTYGVILYLTTWNASDFAQFNEITTVLEWNLSAKGISGKLSKAYSESYTFQPYTRYRLRVTFAHSGEAHFYTTGATVPSSEDELTGILSRTTSWTKVDGLPVDGLVNDVGSYPDCDFSFTYTVEAGRWYYIWFGAVGGTYDGTATLHIDPPVVSVALWDWNASNGTASAEQTKKAYSAITGNGTVNQFSYLVWNDMVRKAKEIIDAQNDDWYTTDADGEMTYLSYADTLMSSEDRTLTAERFNALRFNIGTRVTTQIAQQAKGDIVYGSYFITLAECLNEWIGQL